jgi:anti-sigma factor RsiW
MNVTRDVVKDLLALYLAGEASADTRALVEERLAADPDLAREAEAARAAGPALPPTPAPAPAAEKRALDDTRRLLKSRTSTLVVAALFTVLPLSFVTDGKQITFFLIRDAPIIGAAWWGTAAVLWTCHLLVRRRLRVSGL